MLRVLSLAAVAITCVILVSGASPLVGDDDAALRAALNEYLATVAYPDPKPIDPQLFAIDILAFWSNGETYRGREAVVQAMKVGVREIEADFESFAAKATKVHVRCEGDAAWVTCRISLGGTLTEERGKFRRTIRSTFVFEKVADRWQMIHEHSSRLESKKT